MGRPDLFSDIFPLQQKIWLLFYFFFFSWDTIRQLSTRLQTPSCPFSSTLGKNLLKTLFPIKASPYETSITATCLIYFSLEELTEFPWWTPKHNSFHSDYRKSSSARNNIIKWKTSPALTLTHAHTHRAQRDDDSSWQLATHPGQTELEIVIENITFQLNVLVMAQWVPSTHTDATTYPWIVI